MRSPHHAERTAGPEIARSFRDPHGFLFSSQGRIFRVVHSAGLPDLKAFLASRAAERWTEAGSVIPSVVLDERAKADLFRDEPIAEMDCGFPRGTILEHERIAFPSFPYEWPPEMLYAAANLTLDLALELLPNGLGLKDASPYNVLFRGPQPVFIDVLSFEQRHPGDPTWLPYAQFVRTFLLPLLVYRHFGVSVEQSLFSRRDGLEPEEVYRWLGPLQRIRPPFLSLVSMPTWLARKSKRGDESIYVKKTLPDEERAGFILRSLLTSLKRTLKSLTPPTDVRSAWTDYTESNNYTAERFATKERFVQEALAEHAAKAVLDVGCNTGHFSLQAARGGARVVAIDYDPAVLGNLWRRANQEKLNILPLNVNLTRPTPGVGWRNREWPSFLERARGGFDMVLMLAVVHHMLVTERVPLNEIVDIAADLTTGYLVIEFVSPQDSMFRRLTRGREELYQDLTPAVFESACRRRFEVVRELHDENATRTLYLMRRKPL